MVRAVLFDLDGTIFDSCRGALLGNFFRVARRLSLPITNEHQSAAAEWKGQAADKIISTFWPDVDVEEFIRVWVELDNDPRSAPPLFPGTVCALASLAATGIFLGILTNRVGEGSATHLAEHHRIKDFFSVWYTRDNLPGGSKTDPASVPFVLASLSDLGFSREETVFVGDSEVDLVWARWAGVRFVGVLTGTMTREQFLDAGLCENDIISSVGALPSLLKHL
ncbi:MAG: HAD family hydrolase [Parcubacteria group bacterium]|nr:HAD family hydrolase [Parcubacteria group bacterium]